MDFEIIPNESNFERIIRSLDKMYYGIDKAHGFLLITDLFIKCKPAQFYNLFSNFNPYNDPFNIKKTFEDCCMSMLRFTTKNEFNCDYELANKLVSDKGQTLEVFLNN